ncbi:MAG: acyl-CoA thioesterase [Planctomycetota bacterium]|jgi:acyl-CoA thioester hydrolase
MQAPVVPPSEAIRFRARCRTRWSDEDSQGVLNNAVYLTLLEEARWQYCEHLGLITPEGHFSFVLGQTTVRFLAPGRGPAEVEVETVTTALGRRSLRQAYRVVDPATGTTWAEAEAALVIWDGRTRASADMPERFRRAVADFEGLEA